MVAYEDMFNHTNTEWAPWYIVSADHKWFTRLAVVTVLYNTMKNLNLAYPTVSEQQKQDLLVAKEELEHEDGGLKDKAVADLKALAASSEVTKEEAKKNRKKGKKNK